MLVDKLTEEQKERLAELCRKIDDIFIEEDNDFTKEEANINEYYNSSLYKGIKDTMCDLGKWISI